MKYNSSETLSTWKAFYLKMFKSHLTTFLEPKASFIHEASESAPATVKILRCVKLSYATRMQNHNAITVKNCIQSMCNGKDSTFGELSPDCSLN